MSALNLEYEYRRDGICQGFFLYWPSGGEPAVSAESVKWRPPGSPI